MRGPRHRGMAGAIALAALLFVFLGAAHAAQAEAPDFLTRLSSSGQTGSGAAQLDNPRGVAADPETGHVYVSELTNSRISVFTAWGLFVEAWGWGAADGEEELQSCGPAEPQFNPPPGLCQAGIEGEGKGQLGDRAAGIAVDGTGNVYVMDRGNLRVQKFSPEGDFILMFGGEVNKTSGGDVCTEESGDTCGAGISGTAPSHFTLSSVQDYVAYSPTAEAILVGDKDRIQVFDLDGTYREEIDLEGSLDEKTVNGLDVDAAGNIYLSLAGTPDVFKLSEAGEPLAPGQPGSSKFKAQVPLGVAVDVEGGVYVIDDPPGISSELEARILKYDAAGNLVVPTEAEAEAGEFFPYIPFKGPALNGIATNLCAGSEEPGNLYVTAVSTDGISWADAYGTPPIGCEDPPLRPPHIVDQYAVSVGTGSAGLRAEINPRFWADTNYFVEYGPGECEPTECEGKAPAEAKTLTSEVTSETLRSGIVTLTGLEPNTTYHYRFVAQSGGGGPVYGEGGGEAEGSGFREVGEASTFTTFKSPAPKGTCANDPLRSGPGAELPDCRAYEMVSPLDKDGGEAALWEARSGGFVVYFEVHQSAPTGNRFTFSSTQPFNDPEGASFSSQYLAERTGKGWSSEAISAPTTQTPIPTIEFLGESEFHLFSEDLCAGWFRNYSTAPLTEEAIPGYMNEYRRRNCGALPLYEALSTAEPLNLEAEAYDRLRVHGASEDGNRAIFVANDALLADAPTLAAENELLLYEHGPEGLEFACYLPGGAPSAKACAAGTPAGGKGGRQSSTRNAISADGERVFWTAFEGDPSTGPNAGAPGTLYASVEGEGTAEVSGLVSTDPAWYWSAANDGSRVAFSVGAGSPIFSPSRSEELYEVDVDEAIAGAPEPETLIAGGVQGPLGASEDASVLYFSSSEDLDGAGEGTAGANNLYRHEGGAFQLVMELADADIGGASEESRAPVDGLPGQRSARVSPDGRYATFSSFAPPPGGYENLDAETGERVQEVYRYDAEANGGEGELLCISCNPSGARAVSAFGEAARIQGWEAMGHAPRVISDDGSRVFFESLESLVPRDTNGAWDVYQWEAPGKGTCKASDPTYTTSSGGCVDLLSSGKSQAKSTFLDADPAGNTAFISTQSSLVGSDYGLNDVYAVRIGGGFPEPSPAPECEGEACQSPDPAPEAKTPASATYTGPGNVPAAAPSCAAHAKRARRAARRAKALRAKGRQSARAARRSPRGAARQRRRAKRLGKASKQSAKAARRNSARAKRCRRAARGAQR